MVNDHNTLAFEQHDHKHCIESSLAAARELCQCKGLKLTPIREQVFTLICQSHKPLGAYAILDLLAETIRKENNKRRIAPPTVYRALDFLQEHGLVHRIATLNAYISCCKPSGSHQSHFLICRHCDNTVEFTSNDLTHAIDKGATSANFEVDSACVEIIGICPRCLQAQDTDDE